MSCTSCSQLTKSLATRKSASSSFPYLQMFLPHRVLSGRHLLTGKTFAGNEILSCSILLIPLLILSVQGYCSCFTEYQCNEKTLTAISWTLHIHCSDQNWVPAPIWSTTSPLIYIMLSPELKASGVRVSLRDKFTVHCSLGTNLH